MLNREMVVKRSVICGEWSALSLGDLISKKPYKWHKQCQPGDHTFLNGTDNRVCSTCGFCEPLKPSIRLTKIEIHNQQQRV